MYQVRIMCLYCILCTYLLFLSCVLVYVWQGGDCCEGPGQAMQEMCDHIERLSFPPKGPKLRAQYLVKPTTVKTIRV